MAFILFYSDIMRCSALSDLQHMRIQQERHRIQSIFNPLLHHQPDCQCHLPNQNPLRMPSHKTPARKQNSIYKTHFCGILKPKLSHGHRFTLNKIIPPWFVSIASNSASISSISPPVHFSSSPMISSLQNSSLEILESPSASILLKPW